MNILKTIRSGTTRSNNVEKKKVIHWCGVFCLFIALYAAGFCTGRFRRISVLQSDSNRIEQRTDTIGQSGTNIAVAAGDAEGSLNSATTYNDIANGYIESAKGLAIEQSNLIDETKRLTKAYQESIQLANGTINDLLDVGIRRAELDEQFIKSIVKLYGVSPEGVSEQ